MINKFKGKSLTEISRKIRKKIQIRLSNDIYIRYVDEVDIIPTLKCCLDCVMCHQGQIKDRKNMPYENFKKIILNLKKSGVTKVSLVGGEILILPDIWDFIDFLERKNMKYDLASNLVPPLTEKKINKLKKLKGLEKISTSLDGYKEIHNKIRRSPIAYQRTVENIKKLLKNNIRVNVGCVVQRANFDELEKIIENICKLGVKNISLLVELRITEKDKEISRKIIKKITGKDSEILMSSLKNPHGDLTEKDNSLMGTKREKLKEICKKYGTQIAFPGQMNHPEVLDKNLNLKNYTCGIFSGYNFSVYNDSELAFCPFISIKGENNILKKKLKKIINNKDYINMRRIFKKNGVLPVCRRCCGLCKK